MESCDLSIFGIQIENAVVNFLTAKDSTTLVMDGPHFPDCPSCPFLESCPI